MATVGQMLGPSAFFSRLSGGIQLSIEDSDLQNPDLGGLDGSVIEDPPGSSLFAVSDEQLMTAILRMLHVRTNAQEFQDNPDNRIVATSIFAGRQQIGLENPQTFDTYDLTFQIRLPSTSGDLPDPDGM